jgi:gas vesicle protein
MHRSRRGNEHSTLRDLVFLISGIGIGSATALLLAPASGEDIRYAIARSYRKTTKKIGRRTEELRDRAGDILDQVHNISDRGSRLLHLPRSGEKARRRA